jgi:hypothetical protein
MATVAPSTAGRIEIVEWGQQETAPAAADITAGTFVRQDTSGNWIQALATSAANAKGSRLALRTVKAGEALTAMKSGVVSGFTISQAYNVVPGTANDAGAAHDKNVRIDCPL